MDLDFEYIFKQLSAEGIDFVVAVDLLIDSCIPYGDIKQRAIIFEIGSEKVPVISIPDLIELKLGSGRRQDLSDVELLRKLLDNEDE